tara:strand:+ start:232 stop:462 length:231 start_codon:yes stop_codon:yes gene_type:complete
MKKISPYQYTSINENINKKKNYSHFKKVDPKIVVDINKLLNRVKVEKKNELKKQITLYILVTLTISAVGTLISIIK